MENKGIEFALDWKPIVNNDLIWTINYNLTYNKNEITDLSGVSDSGAPVANTDIKVGQGSGFYLQYNQVGTQLIHSMYTNKYMTHKATR